ncbi:FliI/YscN family ATPase [Pseudoxanthomonas sp. UTMC 1351]|uniref:FliI/YscN family ATPase n=1 Tax=Pseudoxanthomonas sp. UTMC 1351 TaxID=2695853 RepID=UPI0034CFA24A
MSLLPARLLRHGAHPISIAGTMVRARLPDAAVGEACELRAHAGSTQVMARGVVVALDEGVAAVSVLGDTQGMSAAMVVMPTGQPYEIVVSPHLLGSVLDGYGRVVDTLVEPAAPAPAGTSRSMAQAVMDYRSRQPITAPFSTGIRVIDALITTGMGQRMGVFAPAGAGKTTLCEMLVERARADVYVIALVGERGREVASFVQALRASENAPSTVIVQATSDSSPATRCNAAWVATSVAEYFREAGANVLLMMDSMTRYARALRDVALAAGEPPARRGYPASVFEALPRLLERPGRTSQGSITAFYTVLLEDEEEGDVIGEEVKSLLDGHIHLSSRLAGRGHFPAVDVLRSASRLFHDLAEPEHRQATQRLRQTLGLLADMQLMRDLGEYRPGENAQYDTAIAREGPIAAFVCQDRQQRSPMSATLQDLYALAS